MRFRGQLRRGVPEIRRVAAADELEIDCHQLATGVGVGMYLLSSVFFVFGIARAS